MSKYLKICGAALAAAIVLGGAAIKMGWMELSTITDAIPMIGTAAEAEPTTESEEAEEPAEATAEAEEAAPEEEAKDEGDAEE